MYLHNSFRLAIYRKVDGIGKIKILNNSDEFTVEKEVKLLEGNASQIMPDVDLLRLPVIEKHTWKYWGIDYGVYSFRVIDREYVIA